jgi:hypothetical protein
LTSAHDKEANSGLNRQAIEEMARLGVTHVQVDHFRFGGFHYAVLEDAIAAATRLHGSNDGKLIVSAGSTDTDANADITRVPIDYFYYVGYRYTNLKDAIAEAKRHPRAV